MPAKQAGMMKMDDEKISLRISKEELQAIDSYLSAHPEQGSRSLFIKNAIRASLNRDAQASVEKKVEENEDNGTIRIRVPPYLRASVEVMGETMYTSVEDYICSLIRNDIDADGQKAKDVRERAYFVATSGISL